MHIPSRTAKTDLSKRCPEILKLYWLVHGNLSRIRIWRTRRNKRPGKTNTHTHHNYIILHICLYTYIICDSKSIISSYLTYHTIPFFLFRILSTKLFTNAPPSLPPNNLEPLGTFNLFQGGGATSFNDFTSPSATA